MSGRVSFLLSALTLALTWAPGAKAIVVAGSDPDSAIFSGAAYSGVGFFSAGDSNNVGLGACTGALFGSTRVYVMVAAHCVTDNFGNKDVDVNVSQTKFVLEDQFTNQTTLQVANYWNDPLYTGGASAHDLAILQLAEPAPSYATGYGLYTTADQIGQEIVVVGWGTRGTGTTGPTEGAFLPGGKRAALNYYAFNDAAVFANGVSTAADMVLWNTSDARNPFGTQEGIVAPGDSGGPSFINGLIAGIHSFNRCHVAGSCPAFNDIGGDTLISSEIQWINSVVAVPEPATLGVAALALAGLIALRRRSRRM